MLTLSGSGYGPGYTYNYCFEAGVPTPTYCTGVTFTADGSGNVPAATTIIASGTAGTTGLAVVTDSNSATVVSHASFFVNSLAMLSVAPTKGASGTTVTLSGSNYAAGYTYAYCWEAATSSPTACPESEAWNGNSWYWYYPDNFVSDSSGNVPAATTIITSGNDGTSGLVVVTDPNAPVNSGFVVSHASFLVATSSMIVQPIKLTVTSPGKSARVTSSGCSVSPTSISADGKVHTVTAKPSCTITVTLPKTSTTRYSADASTPSSTVYVKTLMFKTCSTGTCSTYKHTIYEQFSVTFAASLKSTYGTTTPAGTKWYQAGLAVPIKATPRPGRHFSHWSSSTKLIIIKSPKSATTTATIDGTGTVTATFT